MQTPLRVHALNDLHLEATRWGDCPKEAAPPPADVVVLAGDIWHGTQGVEWAAVRWPQTPVLYVLGNHELQGELPDALVARCRRVAPGHVHVLEQDTVEIPGALCWGATFWTDFRLAGHDTQAAAMRSAGERMPEYQVRSPGGPPLTPAMTLARHEASMASLRAAGARALAAGLPLIVVTHHPPLGKDLRLHGRPPAPGFRRDPHDHRGTPRHFITTLEDAAWSSNHPELVEEVRASLWVFGHTHRCFSRRVRGTTFVSNSRGMTSIGGPPPVAFQPNLVVEVPRWRPEAHPERVAAQARRSER